MAITTEDHGSVLLEFDSGARGVMTVSQVAAGHKNGLQFEIDGSESSLAWKQERPNELWIGHRNRPNEVMLKDASLMYPEVSDYAHYPGGHNEAYPDGPKNLFRNIYGYLAGNRPGGDFATFEDGHNENAICEAIVQSSQQRTWVDVTY